MSEINKLLPTWRPSNDPNDDPPKSELAPATGSVLPAVGGRKMECSNAEFERRCLVYIAEEQEKLSPDTFLIALLCDAARCVREYSDAMQMGQVEYRLLGNQDAVCPGDQRLCDDCETWEVIDKKNCGFVGQRYDGNAFVPMRRKLQNGELSSVEQASENEKE